MLYLEFLFSLSIYIIIIHAGLIQDKLFDGIVMHMDRLSGECGGKNVPCKGFFQGVTTKSTNIFIRNLTMIIKEGGFKKLSGTITIERCRSKENLDTCEEYLKQPIIDFCKIIDPNNLITGKTTVVIPVVPRVKCPINKGIYHAYNATFDLAPFIFFKIEGFYWKTKMEVFTYEENKLIYCVYSEGYVTNSKLRK